MVQNLVHCMIVCDVVSARKAIPTGMIAGSAGQFLASPMDLVKTRLQAEGKRILEGEKPRCGLANILITH